MTACIVCYIIGGIVGFLTCAFFVGSHQHRRE